YRSFITSLLGRNSGQPVVCEASDGLEAVAKAQQLSPDVILMDIGLPKLNGLEAARRILELRPFSKIVFLTQETSVEVVKEALSLGAWGYVVKQQAGSDLFAALAAIDRGKRFISSGVPTDGFAAAPGSSGPTKEGAPQIPCGRAGPPRPAIQASQDSWEC